MQLEQVRYSQEWRDTWEEFVRTAINGTFLHSRAFFDHNPKNIAEDHSLLFLKKNKVVAVFPAILYEKEGRKIFHAHGRSTYGGIVVNDKVGIEEAVEIIDLIIAEAHALAVAELIVRNPFRIFYDRISDESDYAMWYRHFQVKTRELEIYIDLRDGIEAVRKRYENGTKYNIKKAWKFVTVRESNDLDQFWPILEENLASKHALKPVHSLADMYALLGHVGPEYIKFFGAYYEGKLAGGCLVFICGKKGLHAQYIGQEAIYQEFRPVNAVTDYILEWGATRGYHYFNLGTANEDSGRAINSGLFHFKGSFGGRGVLRETMHLML
jgi:hypothetical protein